VDEQGQGAVEPQTGWRVGVGRVEVVSGRVGVGRVELVAEPSRLSLLRANLADGACRLLILAVFIAPALDTLTTTLALQRPGFFERNPVLDPRNPLLAMSVKFTAVSALMVLALSILSVRRARGMLRYAVVFSLVAPILNTVLLYGAHAAFQ